MAKIYNEQELKKISVAELREVAKEAGVPAVTKKTKAELIKAYLDAAKIFLELNPQQNVEEENKETKPVIVEDLAPKKAKTTAKKKEEKVEAKAEEKKEEKKQTASKAKSNNKANAKKEKEPEEPQKEESPEDKQKSLEAMIESGECERTKGLLDIHPDGFGFLRVENCEPGLKDVYVSARVIKSSGLRIGDMVEAVARKNYENKPSAVIALESVNGKDPESIKKRPFFDKMIPIFPDNRLKLETPTKKSDFAIRCIDLVAPIGKGQRALIVSPPKAGKTTLLKKIAQSITENYPEVELYVLLIDERPEEVTDMQRSIHREVIYSTFDETPEHHCKAAELLIERAKRSVELGKDVVIIMDSLTRLARAYNITIPPTGRTLSGGLDPGALHPPKKFFGSARNIENGGSLTIVATALVDTGSRMDDVIYEEFKGTGNMEIHLDRKLSERRIFPAIDIARSSTRREDLLLSPKELQAVYAMRKWLSGGENGDMTEQLFNMIVKSKDNEELCSQILLNNTLLEKEGFKIPKL